MTPWTQTDLSVHDHELWPTLEQPHGTVDAKVHVSLVHILGTRDWDAGVLEQWVLGPHTEPNTREHRYHHVHGKEEYRHRQQDDAQCPAICQKHIQADLQTDSRTCIWANDFKDTKSDRFYNKFVYILTYWPPNVSCWTKIINKYHLTIFCLWISTLLYSTFENSIDNFFSIWSLSRVTRSCVKHIINTRKIMFHPHAM